MVISNLFKERWGEMSPVGVAVGKSISSATGKKIRSAYPLKGLAAAAHVADGVNPVRSRNREHI